MSDTKKKIEKVTFEIDEAGLKVKKASLKDGLIKIPKIKLPKEFWTESPVTEGDFAKFADHENEYISNHIKSLGGIMNKGNKATKIQSSLEIPTGTANVRVNRKKQIRNPGTGEVKVGVSASVIIVKKKGTYDAPLKKLVDDIDSMFDE